MAKGGKMNIYRERMAAVTTACVCVFMLCACSGAWTDERGGEIEKVKVFYAKTSMEYSTAVSDLVKNADAVIVSKNEGEYESARLLIKSKEALDFSSYEGVCQVITDPEGHYTVQFSSSEWAQKAAEALAKLESVEYVEPDGEMKGFSS